MQQSVLRTFLITISGNNFPCEEVGFIFPSVNKASILLFSAYAMTSLCFVYFRTENPDENVTVKEVKRDFYRATLCVNAILPVDRRPSIRLIVRPSHSYIVSKWLSRQTLSQPGSTIILVYKARPVLPNSQWNLLSAGVGVK